MRLYNEYEPIIVNEDFYLMKTDLRSKSSGKFPYKISIRNSNTIARFIQWGLNENLGPMLLYRVYHDESFTNRDNINWLMKEPGHFIGYTDFYIKKDLLPLVLLHWQQK